MAEKTIEKQFSREDILNAASMLHALVAYRALIKENRYYASDLESWIADKATELGDEQMVKDFTILSAQTRNNERFLRGVNELAEISDSLQRTGKNIVAGSEEFSGAAKVIQEAMQEFDDSSRRISTAGNSIVEAAAKINNASHRM